MGITSHSNITFYPEILKYSTALQTNLLVIKKSLAFVS